MSRRRARVRCLAVRHCPRCLARGRVIVELRSSPLAAESSRVGDSAPVSG
jgi:hypothetical protein